MEMTLIPGYRDFFGDRPASYEQLVQKLPSDFLVIVAAALNDELSEDVNNPEVQLCILQRISSRYSLAQRIDLQDRIRQYKQRTGGGFTGYLFERLFLLEWMAAEMRRNAQFELEDTSPLQEYHLLLAYLSIIDQVHDRNSRSFQEAAQAPPDDYTDYRMLWVPLLYQYQYNEQPYPPYNFYKLISFLVYALSHYRECLREYLNQKKLSKISELMNSFYEVAKAAVHFNEKEFLPGLKYIAPKPGSDLHHLESMTINSHISDTANLELIKRYPLYHKKGKGYAILDRGFYYRKIYLGPYFELFYDTSLSDKMKFVPYSGDISKNVLENICFRHIVEVLQRPKESVLAFDTDGPDFPDGYYRYRSTALLFEFKGYVFPDDLPASPNFDDLKGYIDKRFIANEKGKKKGVGQLCAHIEQLAEGNAPFDPDLGKMDHGQKLTVYPIICFDDFNFTLPGVNEYLVRRMNEMLSENARKKVKIRPLVMVNLDILFRFACGGGSLQLVLEMINFYHKILRSRKHNYQRTKSRDHWLLSFAALDEIFHTLFFDAIAGQLKKPDMSTLLAKQNMTQALLDTIV
jgi:hypothetical protein